MKRRVFGVKLAATSRPHPLVDAFEEAEHPIGRLVFGFDRLIEADVFAPLNVRRSNEPLVREIELRLREGKVSIDVDAKPFAIA